MSLLDENVEIELRVPTDDGYIYARYPLEHHKEMMEKAKQDEGKPHYSRDDNILYLMTKPMC